MKFSVITADPPWEYKTWSAKGGHKSAGDHYQTQGTDWLCALPVQDIAADDCALFLWATWPNLPDCLRLIEAWGFTYKSAAFCWTKLTHSDAPSMGLGYWTRSNTEPCLLATRGNPKRRNKDVRQVIECAEEGEQIAGAEVLACRRGEHSRKPIEVYKRIERLVPGPYCELFARPWWGMFEPPAGWTCLGNEVTGNDIADDIRALAAQEDEAAA